VATFKEGVGEYRWYVIYVVLCCKIETDTHNGTLETEEGKEKLRGRNGGGQAKDKKSEMGEKRRCAGLGGTGTCNNRYYCKG
jgi:hypothetical protein